MSAEYAIIVKNKTRLEALIERFNTKAQAKFYIERSGGDFQEYTIEHETFMLPINRRSNQGRNYNNTRQKQTKKFLS